MPQKYDYLTTIWEMEQPLPDGQPQYGWRVTMHQPGESHRMELMHGTGAFFVCARAAHDAIEAHREIKNRPTDPRAHTPAADHPFRRRFYILDRREALMDYLRQQQDDSRDGEDS